MTSTTMFSLVLSVDRITDFRCASDNLVVYIKSCVTDCCMSIQSWHTRPSAWVSKLEDENSNTVSLTGPDIDRRSPIAFRDSSSATACKSCAGASQLDTKSAY